MKKVFKRIFIGLISIVILIVIVLVWFSIRYSTLTKQMTPIDTGSINDSVYAIKDRYVNAFIFECNKGYVLFDACISEKQVEMSLHELGIANDLVVALILTHSDGDHIGATGLFKNAEIYMHADEEQMITGETARMGPIKYKWKFGDYILVDDKEELFIGGLEIKVVHTPGHTPGSSCFIVNNDYFITGDNLIMSDGHYEHFLKEANMDTEMQIESLKKLPDPSLFKYILTSHNGVHAIE